MLRTLSATDVAIAVAYKAGTLRLTAETGRFGEYVAISDEHGLIEIALTACAAHDRLAAIVARL